MYGVLFLTFIIVRYSEWDEIYVYICAYIFFLDKKWVGKESTPHNIRVRVESRMYVVSGNPSHLSTLALDGYRQGQTFLNKDF